MQLGGTCVEGKDIYQRIVDVKGQQTNTKKWARHILETQICNGKMHREPAALRSKKNRCALKCSLFRVKLALED